jgi:hypothetical protein
MDARTSELHTDYAKTPTVEQLPTPVKVVKPARKKTSAPAARKAAQRRSKKRSKGREVVKSGMAASLAVTMMTGLKILRPMRIHPIASWVFVGLTLVHMIMYESPSKK